MVSETSTLDRCRKPGMFRVVKVDDQGSLRRQLAARGFVPQAVFRVLRAQGAGPLLVEIRHARVAIGRTEAGRIIIVPTQESS